MFNWLVFIEVDRGIENLFLIFVLEDKIIVIEFDFKLIEFNFFGLGILCVWLIMGGEFVGEIIWGFYYVYWVIDFYIVLVGYIVMFFLVLGIFGKVVNSFFMLYFGGFGESFIYWIYFVMGLSGCLLFLSGNIIWIEFCCKKMFMS